MRALQPLKSVAELLVSNVDKKTVEGDVAVRLCNYVDVYYNDRITDSLAFMEATATAAQIAQFELRQGDVLFTKDSETADDIAVPAFVPADLPGVVCGYHLAIARPRADAVDGRYLRWALSSQFAREQFTVAATGVTRFGLRQDEMRSVKVPVPALAAQRAIADYLDRETARVDALITKKQRLIDVLLERRAGTTSMGVAGALGSLRGSACGLPWLESIPPHWRTAKLTLVARLGSGHTPSRSHPEWWVNCTIPWVTTGEVAEMRSDRLEYVSETRECISELGIANSSATVHPAGTVVLCRTASAGYSAIMETEMATSQDFATWTCGPLLRPRYLLLCLRAMRADLLGRLAMGSTHKTIYMPDIEAIRIPLPPIDEQDEIVEEVWQRLHRIDRIVDTTDRQIELLREHRQALITAAVTGELEVPGVAA